ncbi:MAG: CARDB domain-containing protein [Candidatus Peribacteraceae bacterium]|nr:CARDB domain-containing protein [Candidatus Peribacteraceae bacterium]
MQTLLSVYLSLAAVFAGTVLFNGRTPLQAQTSSVLPDYAVENLFVSPALPEAGEEVSFHGRVRNVGQTRGTHRDFVQLQIDEGNNGTWDYTSTLNIVGALSVGATNIVQWGTSGATPPIRWSRIAGTHAMKVCLHLPSSTDVEAYRYDANASNDCSTLVFRTVPVGGSSSSAASSRATSSRASSVSATPDFSLQDLRFFQDATAYAITVAVKNNGASTSKWAQVRLDIDGVRGVMIYGIKPLSTNATDTAVWSSASLPPKNGWVGTEGYHTAIACIDNENGDPADSNAANNCKQITFAMKGPQAGVAVPDFSLQDLRFYQDTTGYAMTVVVKNTGASTNEWAHARLDIDNVRDVMTYGIKPLSTNATDTAVWSSSVLAPRNGWTLTTGTHRATACIDNENDSPADSNAANDCKSITFTAQGTAAGASSAASTARSSVASSQRSSVSSALTSGLPDHVISSMNVAPSGTDGRINAWAVVRNSGNGNSQNYSYAALEYRRQGVTAWTRIMQARYVSALRPEAEEEMNWTNFADYSGLPYTPGTYEFHICADVWESLRETNEGNNCYPPMTVIIPQYGTTTSAASRSSSVRSFVSSAASSRSSARSSVSSARSSERSSAISSRRSSAVSSARSSARSSTTSRLSSSSSTSSQVSLSDYVVTSLTVTPSGNGRVNARAIVQNIGATSTTTLEVSLDARRNGVGNFLGVGQPISGLRADETREVTWTNAGQYSTDRPFDAGDWQFRSYADLAHDVTESNERNNASQYVMVTIPASTSRSSSSFSSSSRSSSSSSRSSSAVSSSRSSARSSSAVSSARSSTASTASTSTNAANLTIVDFVTSPTTITEGNQWGAMGKVKNIGRVRSAEALVRLQFYEFNDSTRIFTSSLERVIPPLNPNRQFSFSWSTRYATDDLPQNVFPGAHRVTACVNDHHIAPESNYNDNCGWMYLLVDPRSAASTSASYSATGVDMPRASSSSSRATSSASSRSLSSSSRAASSSSSVSRQASSQSSSAAAGLPDLWLKQFSMPDSTHFSYTLANIGTVIVPSNKAEMRFEWIDAAGSAHLLFGSTGNSALDPADTAYPRILTISSGLIPMQAQRIRATVDQTNQTQESNEGNNMLEADIVR